MKIAKLLSVFLPILILLYLTPFSALSVTGEKVINAPNAVQDGDVETREKLEKITVSSAEKLKYLYIVYWDTPTDFVISNDEKSQSFSGRYLHRLIEIPEGLETEFSLSFSAAANISEIAVYTEETLPNNIQNWQENDSKADLLVFSTHADDEQLFYAGVLPLYAMNPDCEVQLVYFTDHFNEIIRRHEMLDGLWTVGVTRYPVVSPFPDAYSTSYQGALDKLEKAGYTEENALEFLVEQIRRFKPLVILGQDLNGEYGHGQHILKAHLLTRAVEMANSGEKFPNSLSLYGAYDTPKLYLHLYNQNKITLNLDEEIEGVGKTPFEISKEGYNCHKSQHKYWHLEWMNGINGEITKASQIKEYSPCEFGLYRSTVGLDTEKKDLFENLTMRSLISKPETDTGDLSSTTESQDTKPQTEKNYDFTFVYLFVALLVVLAAVFSILIKKSRSF